MAKLSDAQINAIKFYATGEGNAPQKRTRDSLIKNGLLNENDTVTTNGYAAAGIEVPTTTVDEIEELLNAPIGSLASDITLPAGWDAPRFAKINQHAWKGLSDAEIQKDILTAVPIGRAARRHAAQHANHNH